MESYILVTNDAFKQQIGQRFGIRVKRLEQLREVIAREDRDLRNREQMLKKEGGTPSRKEAVTPHGTPKIGTERAVKNKDDDDEDDEIIFKRPSHTPKAPRASNGTPEQQRVVDPNAFGGRGQYMFTRGGKGVYRGGRGGSSPANNRSNGNYTQRNAAPTAPRQQAPAPVDIIKPIDPDSFSRPTTAKGVSRGGRRRLWEPT
jgi:hypothetical protein